MLTSVHIRCAIILLSCKFIQLAGWYTFLCVLYLYIKCFFVLQKDKEKQFENELLKEVSLLAVRSLVS